jgi:hypothetical protein
MGIAAELACGYDLKGRRGDLVMIRPEGPARVLDSGYVIEVERRTCLKLPVTRRTRLGRRRLADCAGRIGPAQGARRDNARPPRNL